MSRTTDEHFERAIMAHVEGQLEVKGVAALQATDGQMFFFRVDKLRELLAMAAKKGTDRVAVFIQHGPNAEDLPLSN